MTKFIRMVVEQTIKVVQPIPDEKYEVGPLNAKDLDEIQREMDAEAGNQPDPTMDIRQRIVSAEVVEV